MLDATESFSQWQLGSGVYLSSLLCELGVAQCQVLLSAWDTAVNTAKSVLIAGWGAFWWS